MRHFERGRRAWLVFGGLASALGAIALGPALSGCSGGACESLYSTAISRAASYVNTSTEDACTQDSECVVYRGTKLIGWKLINRTAAAGYDKYVQSNEYVDLEMKTASCSTPVVHGAVAVAPTTAVCKANHCVAGGSCDEIHAQIADLLGQFVDATQKDTCRYSSDCVIASTGSMCGYDAVNRTYAAGYNQYLNSAQYKSLSSLLGTACSGNGPVIAGSCAQPPSGASCQAGHCVANR